MGSTYKNYIYFLFLIIGLSDLVTQPSAIPGELDPMVIDFGFIHYLQEYLLLHEGGNMQKVMGRI